MFSLFANCDVLWENYEDSLRNRLAWEHEPQRRQGTPIVKEQAEAALAVNDDGSLCAHA
jgi:predicted metal-dependent HD superfamily phosphohydrolase